MNCFLTLAWQGRGAQARAAYVRGLGITKDPVGRVIFTLGSAN